MTEKEWLVCKEPARLLNACVANFHHLSDRKLRLLVCAVTRLTLSRVQCPPVSPLWLDHLRRSVDAAEDWADGKVVTFSDARNTSCMQESAFEAAMGAAQDETLSAGREQAEMVREVFGNPFRPVAFQWPLHFDSQTQTTVLSLAWAAYDERIEACGHCVGREPGTLDAYKMRHPCRLCKGVKHQVGILNHTRLSILADALEEAGCVGHSHPCLLCGGKGYLMQAAPDRGPAPECDFCGSTGTKHWPHPVIEHLRSAGPHVRGCWALDLILGKT